MNSSSDEKDITDIPGLHDGAANLNTLTLHLSLENMKNTEKTNALIPLLAMNRSISSSFKKKSNSFFSESLWNSGTGLAPTFVSSELEENILKTDLAMVPGDKIIVVHPGSKTWKFGFAKEPFPKHMANVLARKNHSTQATEHSMQKPKNVIPSHRPVFWSWYENPGDWNDHAAMVRKDASILMNKQTRRSAINLHTQTSSYNATISPSIIPSHNDAFKVEFSKIPNEKIFLCGHEAQLLPSNDPSISLRYPIHRRRIFYPPNQLYYDQESNKKAIEIKPDPLSEIHCQDDLSAMIVSGCESLLGLKFSELKNYWIVLVIPDTCSRLELKSWLNSLFNHCNFSAVLLVQESLAAAYGAGCSSALIVDMGAEETSITVVEDGILDVDSRQCLGFGSDDLITLFMELLKGVGFPYTSLSLSCGPDIDLLTDLKERCWSLEDSNELAPQIIDFLVRIPGSSTLSYHFKAFEERFLTPFTYFSPSFIELPIRTAIEDIKSSYFLSEVDSEILVAEKTKKQIISDQTVDDIDAEATTTENLTLQGTQKDSYTVTSLINSTKCNYCRRCFANDSSGTCCCFIKEPTIEDFFKHIKENHINEASNISKCEWMSMDNEGHPLDCDKILKDQFQLEAHVIRHIKESLLSNSSSAQSIPLSSSTSSAEPSNASNRSNENKISSLHESILKCIMQHEDPERLDKIKKWLGMILLVGGGHQISGFRQLLITKLNEVVNSKHFTSASTLVSPFDNVPFVSIISLPKDIDIISLAWKGAGVVARVDASRETWISSKEWDILRMRAVVDRLPHIK